jgi:ribonuclease R
VQASRAVSRQAELLEPIMRERPATREAFGALLLRTLQVARYDTVNTGHAALASPAYVHFTSPIRRYPDIVVHRAACALAVLGEDAPKARGLPEVALRCSQREREAADAERRADAICLSFLLRDRLRRDGWHQTFEGVVTGLIGAGLFVRFGDVFEGFLPARRLDPRERFDIDQYGVALVGRASGRRIRLGDELSCVVTAVDPPRGRATLDLLPEQEAPRSRARPAKRTTPRRPPKPARRKRA